MMELNILWLFVLCSTVGATELNSEELRTNIAAELLDILRSTSEQSYIDASTTDYSEDQAIESSPENQLTIEEIVGISENDYPVNGKPGVDYPDYEDIPETSFTCLDKPYVPGLYADMETGCQVFHVCWPRMRETFLCPIGTTFNQAILACDYWYITNCSLTRSYYIVNAVLRKTPVHDSFGSIIHALTEKIQNPSLDFHQHPISTGVKHEINFMPIKAKLTSYFETAEELSKPEAEPRIGMLKTKKNVTPLQPVTLKHLMSLGKLLRQLSAELKTTPKYSMVVMKILTKLGPEVISNYPARGHLKTVPTTDEVKVQMALISLSAQLVVIAEELLRFHS